MKSTFAIEHKNYLAVITIENSQWTYSLYRENRKLVTNWGFGTRENARRAAVKHIEGIIGN